MEIPPPELASGEVKHLQRCISDLVSLLALPAIWSGADPSQIFHTVLDALIRMLRLDLVSVRLTGPGGEAPVEIVRIAAPRAPMPSAHEICEALDQCLKNDSRKWPPQLRDLLGDGDVSIVSLPLGLHGELGVMVAAAEREDFPRQTETLLLNVAANQACIGVQEARLRSQQKRVAEELDQRVAQRTAELSAANAELQLQVGLLQHLPVSTWTLKPDGTPDFVNRVWLEYSGQTLDFVRSHPEAWMTAVHPEDREQAAKSFWEGVHSGQGFAFETRSLRAQDGTYRWHLQQAVALRDASGKVLRFIGTTTDIDDLKRAQEKLQASESDLRQILDGIPGLVYALTPTGQADFFNRRITEYFGKTHEEMDAWATNDVVHPDDLPRIMAEFTHSFTTGAPFDSELRYRRADGVYRWFQSRILPSRDAEGRIARWYALVTDIEDGRRAEEKLRQEEKQLKQSEARKAAILDSALDCIVTIDHEGCITEFNPAAERTFGHRRDEVVGKQLADIIIPPSLREKHGEGFARYLATGEAQVLGKRIEMAAVRADGSEFPVELTVTRIPLDGPPSFTGYLRDITDRKRAEEKLRHSEALLAEVQSVSLTGGFSWHVDSDDFTFSEEAYRIFEFEKGRPVTLQQITSRIHPEESALFSERMASARSAGGDLDYEIRLRMPDDSVKYLHTISHGIRDREGRLEYVGAIQDITRRRLSEEALNRARSELAHVSRVTSLGAMTASIAHEVRQPLSGIITNASTCLRMLGADPPNIDGARETARRTIRDGDRMSEVITRLRALFSKKEPATESVNLNEAVLEVVALSIVELQKNRVMVRPELADNLPLVTGDRVQLQQVILNLLRNGSDAMSTVEDRPRQLVIRTERDEGDRVCLTVQDSGVGFDPQAVDRLFDPFYTTKSDGMGIGLSVSRSIIERHHGRLWATRNDGPGAAFSFSIPRAPDRLSHGGGIRNSQPPPMPGPNAA